jgi:diketogulonate reductase-like aldo/keto reductase
VLSLPALTRAAQYHPYLQQRELLALCASEGIVIAAYGPLCPLTLWPGGALDAPLAAVAAAHATSPASALLAWPLAQGHAVVTTGTCPGRAAQALAAAALKLSAEEVEAIAAAGAAAPQRRRFWFDHFKDSPPGVVKR